ncbi:MAG TPA: M20/M25/M40 family metallo-hydrolase [Kofleriaceae bacterium]|nr:M20/M25/M40 family metallo-hydrolase [Kofleriaceae bacterium]
MLRFVAIVVVSVVVAIGAGCGPGSPGPGIDVDRAMSEGAEIAFPRHYNGEPGMRVQGFIMRTLEAMGVPYEYMPVGTVDVPRIEVMGNVYRERESLRVDDANLVVRFGPPGKALLVMAHYDSVPGSPGATDNAAAVAIVLELARVLKAEPPQRAVMLVFTAAEEVGLVGAEALAAKLGDEIDFAIALDLIGGDGPLVVNGASMLVGRAELAWLRDGADRAGVELQFPLVHRVVSRWWPQAERSDHGPFTRRGVRAIHFYNRGNDGEWIDLAYHSERDTWPRVHREQVAAVGRLLRALTADDSAHDAVPAYDGDGFVVPVVHWVIARWVLVAIELALAIVTVLALVRQRRVRSPGAGLLIGTASFIVAVVLAIIAERLVLPYRGAWLLSPLRSTLALALVLAGTFGLLTRVVARFTAWTGSLRYRAFASLTCLAIGLAFLAIGAAELAWIWLVPALVIAIAPAAVGVVASLVPAILVLHPFQLREAAWNGFLPASLPLAAAIGLLGAPTIAAVAWAWSSRRVRPGPLGTLVLGVGCGLAVSLGILLAGTAKTTCSSVEFGRFGLACERV